MLLSEGVRNGSGTGVVICADVVMWGLALSFHFNSVCSTKFIVTIG